MHHLLLGRKYGTHHFPEQQRLTHRLHQPATDHAGRHLHLQAGSAAAPPDCGFPHHIRGNGPRGSQRKVHPEAFACGRLACILLRHRLDRLRLQYGKSPQQVLHTFRHPQNLLLRIFDITADLCAGPPPHSLGHLQGASGHRQFPVSLHFQQSVRLPDLEQNNGQAGDSSRLQLYLRPAPHHHHYRSTYHRRAHFPGGRSGSRRHRDRHGHGGIQETLTYSFETLDVRSQGEIFRREDRVVRNVLV